MIVFAGRREVDFYQLAALEVVEQHVGVHLATKQFLVVA